MKKLMQDYDNYALSISATTRQPSCRGKERMEESIFFRTKEEFEKMIARDELIEYARYVEKLLWNSEAVCYGAVRGRQGCDP
mgnify:CR=1 FL=1